MIGSNTPWLRLAIAIHEQLRMGHQAPTELTWPATWHQCEVLFRRVRRAESQNWLLAAQRLRRELQAMLAYFQTELSDFNRSLERDSDSPSIASVRDIHADLLALDREFDVAAYDRREQTLSVTTESIELEGVYLGPFEIRLDVNALVDNDPHPYRVIAQEPHSAAANDSVTHPHVQDESVCEGDGSEPIRKALQQGRLLDFFMIVANLLRTYNSDSPFVSLNDWYGVTCADCGISTSEDDAYTCRSCEASVCDACYCSCLGCDGSFCAECVSSCPDCNDKYCNHCMRACALCDEEVCPECLTDNERCSSCDDQETQKIEEDQSRNQEGNVDVPTHVTI